MNYGKRNAFYRVSLYGHFLGYFTIKIFIFLLIKFDLHTLQTFSQSVVWYKYRHGRHASSVNLFTIVWPPWAKYAHDSVETKVNRPIVQSMKLILSTYAFRRLPYQLFKRVWWGGVNQFNVIARLISGEADEECVLSFSRLPVKTRTIDFVFFFFWVNKLSLSILSGHV